MDVNKVYVKTLMKVNKNLNSNNITLDKQRFVLMYNEEQVRRVLHILDKENNDDNLREIQFLLKSHKELNVDSNYLDRALIELPDDYLDISSAYCLATKGVCKKEKMFLWEIKDKNYTEKLSDEYNKPSFDYREAPYIISDNKLNIFTDSFDIDKIFLTYYKYPKNIDIEGYINLDNTSSSNINPEGDRRFIDRVTTMVAGSYALNYEDYNKYQLEQNRILRNN